MLSPGGSMMISLRQGPTTARPMEATTVDDIERLARRHGLRTVRDERQGDAFRPLRAYTLVLPVLLGFDQ